MLLPGFLLWEKATIFAILIPAGVSQETWLAFFDAGTVGRCFFLETLKHFFSGNL